LNHLDDGQRAFFADQYAQAEQIRKEHKRAAEAAEAAKEQAKTEYLHQWVFTDGTDSMRERLADNLLPRKETINALAKATLDCIGPQDHDAQTVCDNNECMCGVRQVDGLDQPAYAAWKQLRTRLPEGSAHRFVAVTPCPNADGYLADDDWNVPDPVAHPAVELTVPCGPFQFKRTIALQ
jgi:hypothetical protein